MIRLPLEMKTKKYWKETAEAYLYLLPAFVILGMFSFYPVVKSIYMSFFDWSLLREAQYFIGLENYERILNDSVFRTAITNTLRYVIGYVPIRPHCGSPFKFQDPISRPLTRRLLSSLGYLFRCYFHGLALDLQPALRIIKHDALWSG